MPEAFRWKVTSQSTAQHKFLVRAVQLGDGYEQRQPLSLRPKLQEWDVEVIGRKPLIEEIKGFLDARRGVEAFYWQPPGRARLLVKVMEYTEKPEGGLVYRLSFKFQEVLA